MDKESWVVVRDLRTVTKIVQEKIVQEKWSLRSTKVVNKPKWEAK